MMAVNNEFDRQSLGAAVGQKKKESVFDQFVMTLHEGYWKKLLPLDREKLLLVRRMGHEEVRR